MKVRQAIKVQKLAAFHDRAFFLSTRRNMKKNCRRRYRGSTLAKARRVCRRLWPKRCVYGIPPLQADLCVVGVLRALQEEVRDWIACGLGVPAGFIQGPGVDVRITKGKR